MTDDELKALCKRLKTPGVMYDTAGFRSALSALIEAAVAAERERLAQVVRGFPHWLGPQAKRELLAAMGFEA